MGRCEDWERGGRGGRGEGGEGVEGVEGGEGGEGVEVTNYQCPIPHTLSPHSPKHNGATNCTDNHSASNNGASKYYGNAYKVKAEDKGATVKQC